MSDPGGTWMSIEIAGHPCDVFEPAARNEHGYAVLYLHGVHLGRLVDKPAFTAAFARHGLPVMAPITQRSWWSDRICEEFDPSISAEQHVLKRVMPAIAERWQCQPPRIGLLGTSMGGQGALRLAFKHPDVFPIVVALSPAIDFQRYLDEGDEVLEQMYGDAETARQDTATLHVHPLNWPRNIWFACDPTDERWIESSQKLAMKLAALGIPFESDFDTEAGGHGFGYYSAQADKAVDFLAERLERERLRIV